MQFRTRTACVIATDEAFVQPVILAEIFLNNALLEAGHAVRYDGGAKED